MSCKCAESVEFVNFINDLLELVDDIQQCISDDLIDYSQVHIKNLNGDQSKEALIKYIEDTKEQLRTNELVQYHQAITRSL